jgi:molecular chaperone GrpE
LEEIIPVYDNLKLSIANLSEVETKNPWVEGVKYVLQEFKRIMEERGVLEIKTIGEKFDPSTMEAISGQGEIVTKEARAGYKLNNKVIIPAKVILEEKTEGKAEDEIKN